MFWTHYQRTEGYYGRKRLWRAQKISVEIALYWLSLIKNQKKERDAPLKTVKLTLSNLSSLNLFEDRPGSVWSYEESVLKQIGYDPADLNFAFLIWKVAYKDLGRLNWVGPFLCDDEKIVILDHLSILQLPKRFFNRWWAPVIWGIPWQSSPTTKLLIFAEGKLDSKRRLVKLLKRDATYIDAIEPKEQELRQYFPKWSRTRFAVCGAILWKSTYQIWFSICEIQKISFLQSYKSDGWLREGYCRGYSKTLQDNIFDLTQFILGKRLIRRVTWLKGDLARGTKSSS